MYYWESSLGAVAEDYQPVTISKFCNISMRAIGVRTPVYHRVFQKMLLRPVKICVNVST